MISKHIAIEPKNDNYARLAEYIADAGSHSRQGGEKCLMSWCAGCLGDDDYKNGIAEVADIQALNTRTAQSKTYHLMISFRPEDEAKLTPELFKTVERRFAEALGLPEHQRHCGVHKNTGNLHMHIAYNLIHPEKLTMHEPFQDYLKRDRLCRELEREYGLEIDNGREQSGPERQRRNDKAASVEAHTGQQSFESYAKGHRETILHALEAATGWQKLHEALALYGMEIKPHGNGLAVKDRHSNRTAHAMKASTLDRSLSQKKLEARFGPYAPPQHLERIQEHSRYEASPLHRSPERGNLFAEYRAGVELRKIKLQAAKEQENAVLAAIRAEWAIKRREIERMNIAKRNRRNLLQLAKKHETEALAKARLDFQPPCEALRRDVPYTSWNGFLQHKAEQGNETALAVLRSLAESVEAEKDVPAKPEKDWSQHGQDQFSNQNAIKASHAAEERAVLESETLSGKAKTRLLAVLRMEQLAEEERRQGKPVEPGTLAISGFRHTVDHKGTVIFTLPGGGRIMDAGRELFFSVQDKTADAVAKLYAQKKWGKSILLEGSRICREPGRGSELENAKKHHAMER